MNQADVSRLVSRLRVKVNPTYRRLKNPKGPEGRLDKLRKTVTGLIKHERIELNYNRADEARGYAERLISEAIRHGDTHAPTMEMADFWLTEKQLVHKLFKVLAPRYENHTASYTRMFKVSRAYPDKTNAFSVLELKGNPYPSLVDDKSSNRNLLHNVLLDAARKDYRMNAYKQAAESIANLNSAETTSPAPPSTSESKDPLTDSPQKKSDIPSP